jgi:glycosyltransferase involved in cell wall biosynthesis
LIQISAVIITLNEEQNLDRCLSSLEGTVDEIVVVDSFSTDRTKQICSKYKVRFFEHAFEGHIEQKNHALSLASYNHILALDADESLSAELKTSIANVKKNWDADGYVMNRLNNYCGQWIRHGAWYPDRKLRLFDRRKAKWGGVNPHDRIEMKDGSKIGKLKGDLLHYTVRTLDEHDQQIEKFSIISSKELFKAGKKPDFYHLTIKPPIKFTIDYFLKLGFLDGKNGYLIASKSSKGYRMRYQKLKELYLGK